MMSLEVVYGLTVVNNNSQKNERESFEEFLESSPKESEISKEPLLSAFKQKYDFFDDITQQIQSCPRTAVCSWIRIDSSPLRSVRLPRVHLYRLSF